MLPVVTASITMALYIVESYTDIESPAGGEEDLLRNLKGRGGGDSNDDQDLPECLAGGADEGAEGALTPRP